MKQVTREEFYKEIGKENVNITPIGSYPYKTNFSLKNGRVIGYIQDTENPDISEYYLAAHPTEKGGAE